ncbi:MAG: Rpn family recombination-promoting nuclease/putative transposase [Clostridiales bacterium]|nr:Rpn family recombination-promoting nuclease/putative transposase [Clostridiales bacterium]
MIQNISSASAHPSFWNATGTIDYRLTNDYMFRAVLQQSKNSLKSLIASLLHLAPESILSVEITNPIILGNTIDEKTFFLDIAVLLNNYLCINLEMQVLNEHNWTERSLNYLCRTFTAIPKGADYIDTNPAVHIGFLNFTPFPDIPEFYATYQMLNIRNHHLYSDKFTLSVVDLTQIKLATPEDKQFHIDRWATLFKATTWEDIKMLAKNHQELTEPAETLYQLNAEENIRLQCQARQDYYMYQTMTQNRIKQLEAALNDKDTALADKDAALADKDALILELTTKIRQLETDSTISN